MVDNAGSESAWPAVFYYWATTLDSLQSLDIRWAVVRVDDMQLAAKWLEKHVRILREALQETVGTAEETLPCYLWCCYFVGDCGRRVYFRPSQWSSVSEDLCVVV